MTFSDEAFALISLCVAIALLGYLVVRLIKRDQTPAAPARRVERLRAPRRYVAEEADTMDPKLKAAIALCPDYEPLARYKAREKEEEVKDAQAPIPMPRPHGVGLVKVTSPYGGLLFQRPMEPCRAKWEAIATHSDDQLFSVVDALDLTDELYHVALPSEEPEGVVVYSVTKTNETTDDVRRHRWSKNGFEGGSPINDADQRLLAWVKSTIDASFMVTDPDTLVGIAVNTKDKTAQWVKRPL